MSTRRRRAFGATFLAAHASWTRIRDKLFSVAASSGFSSFGSHTIVQLPVRIGNAARISLGKNVFVGSGCWLQVLDPHGEEPALKIGDGTIIAGYCVFIAAKSILIGDEVSICRNVFISDHTHRYEDWPVPVERQGLANIAAIEIADGAWLGENVVIFPGVRIGLGAVVSANSVVTRDVSDRTLVAGAPARVLRRFGGTSAASAEGAGALAAAEEGYAAVHQSASDP